MKTIKNVIQGKGFLVTVLSSLISGDVDYFINMVEQKEEQSKKQNEPMLYPISFLYELLVLSDQEQSLGLSPRPMNDGWMLAMQGPSLTDKEKRDLIGNICWRLRRSEQGEIVAFEIKDGIYGDEILVCQKQSDGNFKTTWNAPEGIPQELITKVEEKIGSPNFEFMNKAHSKP